MKQQRGVFANFKEFVEAMNDYLKEFPEDGLLPVVYNNDDEVGRLDDIKYGPGCVLVEELEGCYRFTLEEAASTVRVVCVN